MKHHDMCFGHYWTLLAVTLTALTAGFLANPGYAADLRVLTSSVGGKDAEEHRLFVKELSEQLGFEIEMVKPETDYQNVLMTTLSSGENYDVVYGDADYLPVLIEQGAVTDLSDIIANSSILSDRAEIPESEWILFDVEGHKYGVPTKFGGGTLPIVRADWLKEFGMTDPTTLDEWEAFFKKAKEVKDAYGLSMAGLYDVQGFMSAAGVKAGYLTIDGKRTIPYATEPAAAMYDWFGRMYKAGYIDPQFATNDTPDMRKLFLTDRAAAVTYWDAWVGVFNNIVHNERPDSTFEAKGVAGVPGPDGKILLRRGGVSLWLMPTNAQNRENAIKFMEFWHTPAGYVLGSLGVKDVDYTISADGSYHLTEQGTAHSMDHGISYSESTTWTNPIGTPPGVHEAQAIISGNNATVEQTPVDWVDVEPIVNKFAYAAMSGEITGAEAVARMQEELIASRLID